MDAVAIGSIVTVVVSIGIITFLGIRLTQLMKRDAKRNAERNAKQ